MPASDTSCGFQVCGSDNQRYSCQSDGWHAAGNSPCSCRCTNGAGAQGRPINPDYTYCGFAVCGADHQHYTCTAGGWSAQHDTSPWGSTRCSPLPEQRERCIDPTWS